MRDSPGSVVTLLCSGIQLYSAERRIADCILKDVKWASVVTSAQLAHASQSSEATVTRLCHKLGFENYRKFQLALARDVMEQQEVEVLHSSSPDPLRQTLQSVQSNRQEEIRATIQALNLRQLRKAMSVLRSAEIIEIEATDNSLPVAMDASLKLSGLGKRCMTSAVAGAPPHPGGRPPPPTPWGGAPRKWARFDKRQKRPAYQPLPSLLSAAAAQAVQAIPRTDNVTHRTSCASAYRQICMTHSAPRGP